MNEERGFKVQPTVHPEMKWVIECRINTANNLGSSSFKRRRKENSEKERDEMRKEKRVRQKENPIYPLGGKAAIEKLLNLHLAGLIGNEEAY